MGLRIHFVVDPHGWCCMGLIVFVWLYNIVIIPKIVLFPHYEEGHIPGILIIIFYGIAIFCLVALVRASITDPGRLPENPKIPHGEREFWELCNKCNLMRPKRSHHCSRCGHCVRRMDHHCPWINNCVGEDNHWLFLQLCFYTELLTCYALMFSFCHYYYFLPLKKRNLDLFVVRHELAIMRLAAFMGITMLVGITGLFYTQLIGIITMLFPCHGLPPHVFLEIICSPLRTIQLSLPGGTLPLTFREDFLLHVLQGHHLSRFHYSMNQCSLYKCLMQCLDL
ncbi:palmitoyltransferase ZDHHC21 isoform X2 [Saimiri boliviensis]|uniref:palmitoyltransferase ZDHHC21 isoform X2 n=1 Tax=Saimiri boliviensis TaxID=27679 RepID=UPI003D7812C2